MKALKAQRYRKHLTQRELAARAGISRVHLARLEGHHEPSLSTLRRLAQALNVPVASLLDEVSSRNGSSARSTQQS
jgi:transcriptional regulator with XRE-family HTH domain